MVDILTLADINASTLRGLLSHYDLTLAQVADNAPIPGSYWGIPEAGIIGSVVYARHDTPVHSILHEACHLIVLPKEKRAIVHTNATDCIAEEDAACYLQIVLANQLADVGSDRLMSDMDTWGYTFRLGSARDWFERDAENARDWLAMRNLLPSTRLHTKRGT